ncbi:MAG TPA: late competence development ComFB family protein [Nitrospirota bacterium]
MDYTIQNANHERVMAVMDKFLKGRYGDTCTCSRCVSDIAALALNYLPPHYYVNKVKKNNVGSPWVMVETAVVEAIDKVRERPNHL